MQIRYGAVNVAVVAEAAAPGVSVAISPKSALAVVVLEVFKTVVVVVGLGMLVTIVEVAVV